jgi:PAS domain S-box-containing protein
MQNTTEPLFKPFDSVPPADFGVDAAADFHDRPVKHVLQSEPAPRGNDDWLRLVRLLDEQSVDAAFWITQDGGFAYVNGVASRWLERSREELLAMQVWDLFSMNAAQWAALRAEICQAGCLRLESKLRRLDGAILPVEIVTNHIVLNGCEYSRFLARDITQRSEAERQTQEYMERLKTANRRLEQYSFSALAATRAKSEFLASMSHEIRTPLTAIIGFAETLLVEGDIVKAPPERIDAIRLIRIRTDLKQLAMEVEYPERIPETIQTDPTRLRQILLNLLSNAVKFTPKGFVRLRLQMERSLTGEDLMVFEVTDTGIGMTAEQQARLFQPFSQAEASTLRRFGGTGLGLSICKRLSEKLGGTIQASSVPGQGSTFRASIATGSLEGVAMIDPRSQRYDMVASSSPKDSEVPRLSCRILLADDAPDNQRLLATILRRAGAEVVVVDDGRAAYDEALAACREGNPFGVILMDMQMPVLTGYEATRQLRKVGYRHPILALTANAMAGEREKCIVAGCDDYACKPVDRVGLLRAVAEQLVPHDSAHRVRGGSSSLPALPGNPLVSTARNNPNLVELLANYVAGLPARAEALEEAHQARLDGAVANLARSLRNTAAVYGFEPLADAARQVESHLKHSPDSEQLDGVIREIIELCHRAVF